MIIVLPSGMAIDRFGHRMSLMIFATALPLLAYILLIFTDATPILGVAVLGCAHGIFPGAIFPLVVLIVEPQLLGTAYGIFNSCINIGLFVSPLLLGFVRDMLGPNESLSAHSTYTFPDHPLCKTNKTHPFLSLQIRRSRPTGFECMC